MRVLAIMVLFILCTLPPPRLSAQPTSADNGKSDRVDCDLAKGDFLVFSLKDTSGAVMKKIECLKKLNIKAAKPDIERKSIAIALTIDNEIVECYFDFSSGKVHTMRIRYQTFFPDKKFGKEYHQDITNKNARLTARFGEPSRTFPFPALDEMKNDSLKSRKMGSLLPISLWEGDGRKIVLGIYPWGTEQYRTAVDIIDEKLSAEEKQNLLDAKNVPFYYFLLGEDETHTTQLWIDEESIKLVENLELKTKLIDFWLRIEYTQEGRRNFVKHLKDKGFAPDVYGNFKYSLYHYQCHKMKYLILRVGYYSYEKKLFEQDPAPQWVESTPGTLGEKLLQAINKYAEKKLKP